MKKLIKMYNEKYGNTLGIIDDDFNKEQMYRIYYFIKNNCDDKDIQDRIKMINLDKPKTLEQQLTKLESENGKVSGGTIDPTVKRDIANIKSDLGTEELNTTNKDVKGAINEVAVQYKDIANKIITTEERTKLTNLKNYDDTEIKNDINSIKTNLGTETLTTNAQNLKGAVNEVAAQYKDIANKTIIEGNKLYLAKSDGTKLDDGTELPSGGTGTSYDDSAIKADIANIKSDLGTAQLTTTAKDIKGAVNELNTKIGTGGGTGTSYDDTAIRNDINSIKTDLGTETLTTTTKTVKGAINEVASKVSNNIINVKTMGAKGDGATNDLSVLKTIFNSVKDNQIIYFPEGTYLLGSGNSEEILLKIANKNNVKIKGQSKENTKIIAHQNTPASNNMGMISLDSCTNCSIEDIQLDGNSQLRNVAYGGTNWSDNDRTMKNTSNIIIIGGEYVTVKNVYSHHPIMDCICIERKGGESSPASKNIYVEDCILDYGYRQGISIVGSDYGIIKNTKITNTANALDLTKNDNKSTIGTSPKAGIDSETFIWNHHWLIENCYFESNKGGHINMNDGASEHIIERCTFIGDSVTVNGIGSETPSNGTRTLNNIVSKCDFRNCRMETLGGIFTIINNTFIFDDTSIKNVQIKLSSNENANNRNGACIFSNNRVSVRLDLFKTAGIDFSTLNFCIVVFEKHGCIVSNNIFHNLIGRNIFGAINSNKTIVTNNTFSTDQDLKNLDIACNFASSCIVSNNIVVGNYPTTILDKVSNIMNTQKFTKEQNKYKICDSISLYKNRKISFKIMNFADLNMLNAKVTILEKCVNDKHEPTKIEYDIAAYRKNSKLLQKCNLRSVFGNDEYFVTCFGFEVIDGVLYLSFLNELDDSETVDINIEIDDINKNIDPDILDLRKIALNENIPSLYEIDVKAKQYNVGDIIRSGYRCAEMYYEVTTGGTVTSNETFDSAHDYTVNGVVFKYKGYYRTNTFGSALTCSRLVVPSSLNFASTDTKTIRVITFPVNTTDRITYTSDTPSIATVTNTGIVTPKGNGDAKITITCGNQTKTCNIHVSGI